MQGFFQDFYQTLNEQALPPQAVQDLLKSLFIFFITPLLLLGLACVIASRAGHLTSVQFSSGEKWIVLSNTLPPGSTYLAIPDHNNLTQDIEIEKQNPNIFCESIESEGK